MGLDIGLYLENYFDDEDDEFNRLIQYGVELANVDFKDICFPKEYDWSTNEHTWFGRAYDIRFFADYVRQEKMNMPHTSRITLSEWELFLPQHFTNPVQLFPGGESELEAFGLPPRDPKWDNPEKAIKEYKKNFANDLKDFMELESKPEVIFGLGSGGGIYGFPGYDSYYWGTKAVDLYCLSSSAILEELMEYFKNKNLLEKSKDVDNYYADFHDDIYIRSAAFLYRCCKKAVEEKAIISLSG